MQDYRAVKLGRCERRIMNLIYQCGHASVAPCPRRPFRRPAYSTVRALLPILEEKGHLTHEKGEPRNSITPHNRAIKLDATHSNRLFRPSSINPSKKRLQRWSPTLMSPMSNSTV